MAQTIVSTTTVCALFVGAVGLAADRSPAVDDAHSVRECSYALWYPWYLWNQSRKPADPEVPKPEPDGPRDPVDAHCIGELVAKRHNAGQPAPDAGAITALRGAAKAGKAAALFQAFDEMKASRQKP